VADDLGLSWRNPSPRLLTLRRLEVGAIALVLVAVSLGIGAGVSAVAAGAVAGATVVITGVVAEWLVRRRVRAWGFAEREEDLLVRRGVMFKRLSVVPYGRMQFVDVTAGPFERAFGLATVQLHTAAAASDARIPGLPAAEANRLRDQLATLGESHAAGL
jgi:membrane protein YdbS with pleckstrin-like domain